MREQLPGCPAAWKPNRYRPSVRAILQTTTTFFNRIQPTRGSATARSPMPTARLSGPDALAEAPQRILVTGFEPFGGDDVNPSALVAEQLNGTALVVGEHRITIVGHVLPCAFDDALVQLHRALDLHTPAIVLCTGLAAGREGLTFERVALNLADARIADNVGAQPIDGKVVKSSTNAHFTQLPVKAMVQAALEAGVPASLSLSAGTYVCNAVFFALLHRLARTQPRKPSHRRKTSFKTSNTVRGGFVHLPLLPDQLVRYGRVPSMPLASMVLGLQAALAAAVTHRRDLSVAGGSIA